MATKICPMCNIEKDVYEFGFQGPYVKGYCKPCANNYKRSPGQIDKTRMNTRRKDFKKKYSITPEDYDKIYDLQNGRCAICSKEQEKYTLAVDHCHDSNQIRGLLCQQCNVGIGMFNNEPSLLIQAAGYLAVRKEEPVNEC